MSNKEKTSCDICKESGICQKKSGLPIFLTRYGIAPKTNGIEQAHFHGKEAERTVYNTADGEDIIFKNITDSKAPKLAESFSVYNNKHPLLNYAYYTLRILRMGYVYVFDQGRYESLYGEQGENKIKNSSNYKKFWQVYYVKRSGFLVPWSQSYDPKWSYDSKGEKKIFTDPCYAENYAQASYITVTDPDLTKKIWIAFSDVEWTEDVLSEHTPKSPGDISRLMLAKGMREFDVLKWIATCSHDHAAKISDLEKHVADFNENVNKSAFFFRSETLISKEPFPLLACCGGDFYVTYYKPKVDSDVYITRMCNEKELENIFKGIADYISKKIKEKKLIIKFGFIKEKLRSGGFLNIKSIRNQIFDPRDRDAAARMFLNLFGDMSVSGPVALSAAEQIINACNRIHKKGAFIALDDPVGITQELAGLMEHRIEAFASQEYYLRKATANATILALKEKIIPGKIRIDVEKAVAKYEELRNKYPKDMKKIREKYKEDTNINIDLDMEAYLILDSDDYKGWITDKLKKLKFAHERMYKRREEADITGKNDPIILEGMAVDRIPGKYDLEPKEALLKTTPKPISKEKIDSFIKLKQTEVWLQEYDRYYYESWRIKFVEKEYKEGFNKYIQDVISEISRVHADWLASDELADCFIHNFSTENPVKGDEYPRILSLCIGETQDKPACEEVLKNWMAGSPFVQNNTLTSHAFIAPNNLLLRAMVLNQSKLAAAFSEHHEKIKNARETLKKEASTSTKKSHLINATLDWRTQWKKTTQLTEEIILKACKNEVGTDKETVISIAKKLNTHTASPGITQLIKTVSAITIEQLQKGASGEPNYFLTSLCIHGRFQIIDITIEGTRKEHAELMEKAGNIEERLLKEKVTYPDERKTIKIKSTIHVNTVIKFLENLKNINLSPNEIQTCLRMLGGELHTTPKAFHRSYCESQFVKTFKGFQDFTKQHTPFLSSTSNTKSNAANVSTDSPVLINAYVKFGMESVQESLRNQNNATCTIIGVLVSAAAIGNAFKALKEGGLLGKEPKLYIEIAGSLCSNIGAFIETAVKGIRIIGATNQAWGISILRAGNGFGLAGTALGAISTAFNMQEEGALGNLGFAAAHLVIGVASLVAPLYFTGPPGWVAAVLLLGAGLVLSELKVPPIQDYLKESAFGSNDKGKDIEWHINQFELVTGVKIKPPKPKK